MDLVVIQKDEPFTTSMVIAEGTGNQHKSVAALIKKHHQTLERFGAIQFSDLKSLNPKGGLHMYECFFIGMLREER